MTNKRTDNYNYNYNCNCNDKSLWWSKEFAL